MVQWFVCLSVAMTTSQGNGYGTRSIWFIQGPCSPTVPASCLLTSLKNCELVETERLNRRLGPW